MNDRTESAAGIDSLADIDAELMRVLDCYVVRRNAGGVDHDEFAADYPEYAKELPQLLASIDALEGLAPDSSLYSISEFTHDADWKDIVSTTIGDYRILREIGRGGMGIVYEAEQISLDRRVALKVLPLPVVLDEQQISRFMVEAQAAAQLHHPNIVPIYSVGREDGVHCYSMPLIDGVSLDQRIADMPVSSSGSVNSRDLIKTSVKLVGQAARALEHAHQRGVIHRDIKPSNLMVDRADKLWVTDFGLARCRQDSDLTQSGAIVGTLRYMSPEQASGQPQAVDHRTDIYSLGITLYELVTRCPAFDEGPRAQLIAQRRHLEPRSPRKVNPKLPRDLETVVLKSIAIVPGQRYQSAGEFADDLQRFFEGKPILARRPSVADRVAKWTSRYRKAVAIAAVLLVIALVGSLVATTKLQNALEVADANLEQSNVNFRRTREVLDHFGLMAAERLRGVAGAEEIREQLVRDLLNYYEEFVVTASSDPNLEYDLATTHFRAARIMEELGARQRALLAYRRAEELFHRLAQQTNGSDAETRIQFQIGLCANNIGLLLAERGRYADAKKHYQRAVGVQSALAATHHPARRELANVRGNLGLLFSATGDIRQAETQLETSLEILESINRSGNGNSEIRSAMATTLNNLGYLFQDTAITKAISFNGRAIELLRSAADAEGKFTAAISRSLATSLNNQAALHAKQNRIAESLSHYSEALSIYHELVDHAPPIAQYSEELAITYNNFGRLLMRTGRHREARMSIERSRDLLLMLSQRRPDESRYRASLGAVMNNLARVAIATGDLDQAISTYRASIDELQTLEEMGMPSADFQRLLVTTYENYESALRKSGRTSEADSVKSLRASL